MTNEEYFLSWAKEYEDTINALTERIAELREKLREASPSELVQLNLRLDSLYKMRQNSREVMDILLRKAQRERERIFR